MLQAKYRQAQSVRNTRQAKDVVVQLTGREAEVLNTNIFAEIMKLQLHYGNDKPERQRVLYAIRDKLIQGCAQSNGTTPDTK